MTTRPRPASDGTETVTSDASAQLLDLLGDEYTRVVLEAIRDSPKSGAEVAATTSISKPTAFRRLNALVDIGLVETRQCVDTDGGHHCKQYRLVVDSVSVVVADDGLAVTVRERTSDHGRARSTTTIDD